MSAWATTWAYEQDIKPCGKKAVLVALAHFADVEGFCYPSQETLGDMTSQGVSTVRSHIDSLRKSGVIVTGHRYKKGKRTSDGFYLQAPAERLQPQRSNNRSKSAVARDSLPLTKQGATAENPASLPPRVGDDLSVDLSVIDQPTRVRAQEVPRPQTTEPMEELVLGMVDYLATKIGPIVSRSRQTKAVKWLLENNYDPVESEECLNYFLSETWRTMTIDWVLVQKEIGNWKNRLGSPLKYIDPKPNGHGAPQDEYRGPVASRPNPLKENCQDCFGVGTIIIKGMALVCKHDGKTKREDVVA